ncbi:MAG: hypothetical protein NUV84_00985, partial [Candidatus Uhrbacteria bacterium]|nr:hypothetical protein [Candidatus Uhrbacteria bacterium]
STSTQNHRTTVNFNLKSTYGFSLSNGQSTLGLLRYTNAWHFREPLATHVRFNGTVSPVAPSDPGTPAEPETPTDPAVFSYYDPANYLPTGEIKTARSHHFTSADHQYSYFDNSGVQTGHSGVWDQASFTYDLSSHPKTWALSMAHASQILRQILRDPSVSLPSPVNMSPNAIVATAIKESSLGYYHDGYFQIEGSGSAFAQLQSTFSAIFTKADYDHVIAYDNFETSAISRAFYDIFMYRRFLEYRPDALTSLGMHEDTTAFHKLINIAYNRGGWHPALDQILNNRYDCATIGLSGMAFENPDVLQCLDLKDGTAAPGQNSHYDSGNADEIAYDHAMAIVNYTKVLDAEMNADNIYDAQYTLQDFLDYATILRDLYPDFDLTSTITVAFGEQDTDHDGSISFRTQAGPVLDAIILALPAAPRSYAEMSALNPW